MNRPFRTPPPNPPATHLVLPWEDLETALKVLATPDRRKDVRDTIAACRALPESMGVGRAVTIATAVSWLTDDRWRTL